MILASELFPVGTITKSHGTKGELVLILDKIEIDIDSVEYVVFELDGIFVPFFIDSIREISSTKYHIIFDGLNTIEDSSFLVMKTAFLSNNISSNSSDIYLEAIVGFELYDVNDNLIGEITDYNDETINVLIEVNGDYIPFVEDFIVELDIENRKIKMDLPEGLL